MRNQFIKKIVFSISVISLSIISNTSIAAKLNIDDYKKIETTFIKYAEDKGDTIINIKVNDFNKVSEEEKNEIKEMKKIYKSKDFNFLTEQIINNKWSNNHIIYKYNNTTVFLYPENLKPIQFTDNNCNYISLISDLNSCLTTYIGVKENLSYLMKNNNIFLNNDYLSDFLYIHELSHLLPEQKKLPDFNKENIWIDNTTVHYSEIYSDIFSIIFLHNNLGYQEENINDVITMRNFKLFSSPDLIHYSVPYIKEMLKNNDWKHLKSFDEIDSYIKNLYVYISKEQVISKKRFPNILKDYKNFCNGFNLVGVESTNVVSLLKKYCEKARF